VINPPQSCILAVGSSTTRIQLVDDYDDDASDTVEGVDDGDDFDDVDDGEGDDQGDCMGGMCAVARTSMGVTLSSDERVVDGENAALFLRAFQGYLEDPTTMLA